MPGLMRPVALAGGVAAVTLALAPPLSNVALHLVSAHMLQHLIVILVAAPLLSLGVAGDADRVGFLRPLFRPAFAWLLFVAVFVLWHWPAMFRWAAQSAPGRLFEEASILAAALPFWSVALSGESRMNYGARALFVVAAAVATDLPGVMMVFAPQVLCTMPHEDALRFGLTPLEDQQIAGLIMWVPANLAFFAIATWLFARWLSDDADVSQGHSPQSLVTP
jgi:cytochrome c oxidase assembly factor CtaG